MLPMTPGCASRCGRVPTRARCSGAAFNGRGWDEIGPVFERLGSDFDGCASYQNDIIAAEAHGDLAYTLALEHVTASVRGSEPTTYVPRATTIFRRGDGEWKVVHRHGDPLTNVLRFRSPVVPRAEYRRDRSAHRPRRDGG